MNAIRTEPALNLIDVIEEIVQKQQTLQMFTLAQVENQIPKRRLSHVTHLAIASGAAENTPKIQLHRGFPLQLHPNQVVPEVVNCDPQPQAVQRGFFSRLFFK